MEQQRIVFNVNELCEYLHISQSSVRKLVRENAIPYFRILAKILFDKDSIDLWLKQKELKFLAPPTVLSEIEGGKYGTN